MTRIGTLVHAIVGCAAWAALVFSTGDILAQSTSQQNSSIGEWRNSAATQPSRRPGPSSFSDWATTSGSTLAAPAPSVNYPPPAWSASSTNRTLTTAQPRAATAEPKSIPTQPQPQPVAADAQPVAVEPQPVAVEPQPVAAQPQPIAAEPMPASAPPKQTRWLTPTPTPPRQAETARATSSADAPPSRTRPLPQQAPPEKTAPKPTAPRAPRRIVPPPDAQPLSSAKRIGGDRLSLPSPRQSAARTNESVGTGRASGTRRPPLAGPHPNNDGWIQPLRQTAYQSGGPEEFREPNGDRSVMRVPTESEEYSDGEWIDGDVGPYYDGHSYGDSRCDGQCGADCQCGATCGCGDTCGDACGDGDCEPGCGCSSGAGDSCNSCGRQADIGCIGIGDDESCDTVRVRVPRIQEIVVFGGVHGFKGPYDQNRDGGNFGFQEGINFGAKVPFCDAGYQLGFQSTQSQLSGDANTGDASSFTQHFVTGGVFRRNREGLQGGLAWDLLSDERDGTVRFEQLRGEVSFVDCGRHEWGALLAVHIDDNALIEFDGEDTIVSNFQATDQYTLFYRLHGKRGGEGRLFAGITDDSDALVGADFLLPLMDRWSLESEFTYLIPDDSAGPIGARQEAWNLAISLVWHWKGRARASHSNPYRPLFNVANNGSMIIDDRP